MNTRLKRGYTVVGFFFFFQTPSFAKAKIHFILEQNFTEESYVTVQYRSP